MAISGWKLGEGAWFSYVASMLNWRMLKEVNLYVPSQVNTYYGQFSPVVMI